MSITVSIADRTLKTRAYRALKAMIHDGRLRPGQNLAERDQGEALRRAVARLEKEAT